MKLAWIFRDGMIFAAGKPIRIFGEHEGIVTAEMDGARAECMAHGRFVLTLPAHPAGGPFTLTVFTAEEKLELTDVMVGDVYLFAGQSNMGFTLREESTPSCDYVTDDGIRFCSPEDPAAGWHKCDAGTVETESALAYLVAVRYRRKTWRPFGAVRAAQGASVIESWLPAALACSPAFRISKKAPDHTMPEYASWNGDGVLYERLILSLAPFSFSGVIWYQGESDVTVEEGAIYDRELTAMINTWRRDFGDALLPFVVVQIAETPEGNFDYWPPDGWQAIRDAQARVAEAMPRVKLAVSRDVCEATIHPVTKTILADRIVELMPGQ